LNQNLARAETPKWFRLRESRSSDAAGGQRRDRRPGARRAARGDRGLRPPGAAGAAAGGDGPVAGLVDLRPV